MKKINFTAVLLLCAAMVLTSGVMGKKIKDLKYPALHDFEIPEPDKVVLDNGMTIYMLEDHSLPKVELLLVMRRCGSYLEPAHLVGLASITGQVMRTGGTAKMSGDVIDEELEGVGASVESDISTVTGSISAQALSEYAEKIVSITADIARNPVFDEDKIELAKTQEKTAISRRNDEPESIVDREFDKIIYGAESPYARYAEYATVDAITRDDLIMFHKMTVKPKQIQLAVWGDFDKDEMLTLIKKYFGDWASSETETPPPPDVDYTFKPSVGLVEKSDLNQSTIYVGHIGSQMGDPDYPAILIMSEILCGGFGSRVTENVRTRLGLAYSARGYYSFNYNYKGEFLCYAITKSQSTAAAIREIKTQIASMLTDPPTEMEMKLGKDGWLNSFVFQFDTKSEVILRMLTYDYFGLPQDYIQQVKKQVEALTSQDIVNVARKKLDPKNLHILVIGKAEDFDEPLSVFGDVNEIDVTIPGPSEEEFSATEEELTAGMEILKKTAEACGGLAAFKAIANSQRKFKATINMPQGSMTLDVESINVFPGKMIQTLATPMGDQVVVVNGDEGWMSMAGKNQGMPAADMTDKKSEMERNFLRLFASIEQPYYKVARKGKEEFNGVQGIRLNFMTDAGNQFTMFVNPNDFLPLGFRYNGETMMGPAVINEIYSNFTKYGSILQPRSILQDSGNMSIGVELVTLETNVTVDQNLFVRPEGI